MKIHHLKDFNHGAKLTVGIRVRVVFPHDYRHVATLDVPDNLDEAFRLTQHINGDWGGNENVSMHVSYARSTSVGDVVELSDGSLHRCENVGWKRIL